MRLLFTTLLASSSAAFTFPGDPLSSPKEENLSAEDAAKEAKDSVGNLDQELQKRAFIRVRREHPELFAAIREKEDQLRALKPQITQRFKDNEKRFRGLSNLIEDFERIPQDLAPCVRTKAKAALFFKNIITACNPLREDPLFLCLLNPLNEEESPAAFYTLAVSQAIQTQLDRMADEISRAAKQIEIAQSLGKQIKSLEDKIDDLIGQEKRQELEGQGKVKPEEPEEQIPPAASSKHDKE